MEIDQSGAGPLAASRRTATQRLGRLYATMTEATEVSNAFMDVVRVPMFTLDNNYGWLLRDRASGVVAAVDPAAPDLIQQALDERYGSCIADGVMACGQSACELCANVNPAPVVQLSEQH